MASVSPHSIESMPYNCTWRIMEYLDVLALREMRQVSKRYKLFSDADRIWQIHAASLLQKLSTSQNAPTRGFRALFYQNFKLWSISTITEGLASENHVVFSKPSLLNWGTAVINYPRVRNRKQYCEFLIEDSREGFLEMMHKIVIGLVPENFDEALGHCIGEGQSFGYIASSGCKVGGGGAEPMAYGEAFKNGDRVGLLADPVANELRFYKNGVCQGVAFSNFMDANVQSYQFAVSLARSHMKVRILADVPVPTQNQLYPEYRLSAKPVIEVSSLPLSKFPADILTSVFQKLHISDVNQMRLVRKDWAHIASSDYIWRPAASHLAQDAESILAVTGAGDGIASSSTESPNSAASSSTSSTSTSQGSPSDPNTNNLAQQLMRDVSIAEAGSDAESPEDAESRKRALTSSTGSLSTFRLSVMRNMHRFSTKGRGPGLDLSRDRTRVTSNSSVTYWSAIRMDYPCMQSGVHYAEFQIDIFRHGSIGNTWKMVCGVVSEEFDYVLTKWVGVDAKSFGFIAANGKAVGPLCKNLGTAYADGFMENDRIGVLVDFPADQISFYKNGINLGVAFDGFSKQVQLDRPESNNYYFAVSLARWGMQISVIPGAKCPDREISAC